MRKIDFREIHLDEFNAICAELRDSGRNFRHEEPGAGFKGTFVWIWEKTSYIYLYFWAKSERSKKGNWTTKRFKTRIDRSNNGEYLDSIEPGRMYRQLNDICGKEYFDLLHMPDKEVQQYRDAAACGIQYNLIEREGERIPAIEYDRNSAFAWGMLQPMPDTLHPLGPGEIIPGAEIGINITPGIFSPGHHLKFEGYCSYRFPMIPTPFAPFVKRYYNQKKRAKEAMKTATTVDEVENLKKLYQDAKNYLNYPVGVMKWHNPIIRTAIIEYNNIYIRNIIRKYHDIVIYSNVDSIVASERIPEIENNIGGDVGQWKIEQEGIFVFQGYNTTWLNADGSRRKLSYRGVSENLVDDTFIIGDDLNEHKIETALVWDEGTNQVIRRAGK